MHAIVKEDKTFHGAEVSEVQAFRDYCWPDAPVYLDEPRAFYNALGGGKANKSTLASFLAKIVNPWSRLSKNAKRAKDDKGDAVKGNFCLLYTSPSPRDKRQSRMPSSA